MNKNKSYELVGKLLSRRYDCEFCNSMRKDALTHLNEGPDAVIKSFADYNGMLCGSAEWAKYAAMGYISEQERQSTRPLTMDDVFDLIREERAYQDKKWGTLEDKGQSCAGYLVVLEKELDEAKDGWMKNVPGRDSTLGEVVQVAAVAVACLEQYGNEGNPK